LTDRAYDYVHVTAAYWALYRVARNYPALVTTHTWQWYINQAVFTIQAMMSPSVGFNADGLMGETVFRLLLDDLKREGLSTNATFVEAKMKTRWTTWSTERYPFVSFSFKFWVDGPHYLSHFRFGSEMVWDSYVSSSL
jgi:hypothetical protein